MIGRGSGANLFAVGDHVRFVASTGKTSLPAKVTAATFIGVSLDVIHVVRGQRVVRSEFVPKSQFAKQIRVLGIVPQEKAS